jgi:hypothetical protein
VGAGLASATTNEGGDGTHTVALLDAPTLEQVSDLGHLSEELSVRDLDVGVWLVGFVEDGDLVGVLVGPSTERTRPRSARSPNTFGTHGSLLHPSVGREGEREEGV